MIAFLAHAGMIRYMIVHILDILIRAILQAGQAELAFVMPYRAAVLQRNISHRADFHADTAFTAVILCEEIHVSLCWVKAEDDLLRHRIRGHRQPLAKAPQGLWLFLRQSLWQPYMTRPA